MIIKQIENPPSWVRLSALGGGDNPDTIRAADLKLENTLKPQLEEPAVIHPFNTSTVKVRNNGMIDMFVATDQGNRIDPYSKTVNAIADGLKWHLGYFVGWIENDARWYANQLILFKSEQGAINLLAETDIIMTAGRDVTIKCGRHFTVEVEGHTNITSNDGTEINSTVIEVNSDENTSINAKEDIKITSNTEVNVNASDNIEISSNTIALDGGGGTSGGGGNGTVVSGSAPVTINGTPVARLGDEVYVEIPPCKHD